MRATFITLVLEDGADADVLEHRVTHTKQRRSAFRAGADPKALRRALRRIEELLDE